MGADISVVRCAAPEDLRPGQYVTITHEKFEFYPFCQASESVSPPTSTTLVSTYPNAPVAPIRIVGVCLPLVHARGVTGKPVLLDLRLVQVAIVNEEFAKTYAKAVRAHRKRRKRESSDDTSSPSKNSSKKN
ncbi:MAG: hypothetical protein ACYTF7_12400 [Planctomycetota bacterium]|jgi:hypothetical protein